MSFAGGPVLDEGYARELMDRARAEGVNLVGPGGLLGLNLGLNTEPASFVTTESVPANARPRLLVRRSESGHFPGP